MLVNISIERLEGRRVFFGSRAKILYELIAWKFRNDTDLRFMNYGFAFDDAQNEPPLSPEEEAERYCVQLYHAVATLTDLKGLSVLDVGSGRGGGAAYVHRQMRPAATVGCDLCRNVIAFCQKLYGETPGLGFVRGDAMELPFTVSAFDVVLSVESTHCYPDRSAFISEAHRVVRPGGQLLLADFTPTGSDPRLTRLAVEAEIAAAGFRLEEVHDITHNIVRGLDLDNDRRLREIQARFPWGTRRLAQLWAGTRDSWIYRDFAERRREYLVFRATKPAIEVVTSSTAPKSDETRVAMELQEAHPA